MSSLSRCPAELRADANAASRCRRDPGVALDPKERLTTARHALHLSLELVMKLDLNRAILSAKPLNQLVNELIETAEPPSSEHSAISRRERYRLGMSAQNSIQLALRSAIPGADARHLCPRAFLRGVIAQPPDRSRIQVRIQGPPGIQGRWRTIPRSCRWDPGRRAANVDSLIYPAIWEHKALGAKGWRAIERDGLTGLYQVYAAQVALYQAYLDCTNPALFSVLNADTCERLELPGAVRPDPRAGD